MPCLCLTTLVLFFFALNCVFQFLHETYCQHFLCVLFLYAVASFFGSLILIMHLILSTLFYDITC